MHGLDNILEITLPSTKNLFKISLLSVLRGFFCRVQWHIDVLMASWVDFAVGTLLLVCLGFSSKLMIVICDNTYNGCTLQKNW
jgi:hypothetical protein